MTALRIAPAGLQDVHDMLVNVANSLIAGGESGMAHLAFRFIQSPAIAHVSRACDQSGLSRCPAFGGLDEVLTPRA